MSESEDELPSFWIIESNTVVRFSWQKMSERKPGAWEKYLWVVYSEMVPELWIQKGLLRDSLGPRKWIQGWNK